jgi:hypothetical protein
MAKTPAERVREYRERQAEAAKAALLRTGPRPSYFKRPFSEFVSGKYFEFDENLDAYGVRLLGTQLDEERQEFPTEHEWEQPLTSLDRARGLMGVFLDAAKELAALINRYKLEEIERAIDEAHELGANGIHPGNVDQLKEVFAEIERLKSIRTDLRRATRHTLLGVDAAGE